MPFCALDLFDFTSVSSTFYFAVRILLTILAGLIGWFVFGPTSAMLHRLAFQKPISGQSKFVARLGGALVLAALAFFLIPLGGGRGPGPGGPGTGGYGTGGDQPGGGGQGSGPGGGNGDANGTGTGKSKAVLIVEIVAIKNYEKDSGKYYLIDSKEPALTLAEVESILKQNKGKWGQLNIIVYANSFPLSGSVFQELEELAKRYSLTPAAPPQYQKEMKPIKGMGSPGR